MLHDGAVTSLRDVLFGTSDPLEIAGLIDGACVRELRAAVAEVRKVEESAGYVAMLRLADGRDVVVKAYQPRWTEAFLDAVVLVQAHVAAAGFPAPTPIAGPFELGRGHATAETWLLDPGPAPLVPSMLAVSAQGLAQLVERCRHVEAPGLSPHPMDVDAGALYPEPHSPIFDFVATAEGAEWIDALARAARERRDGGGPAVIAHTDWSRRNVRMDGDRVLAVYDWDSLALVTETEAVGKAASTWSALGEGPESAPSPEEVAQYVVAYEAERGRAFDDRERTAIGAEALYTLAYTARCEHAIDPDARVQRRARPRLAEDGDRYLDLALLLR
jgi:Ser/Thr protein kinase RdoA (MazF antagonist)